MELDIKDKMKRLEEEALTEVALGGYMIPIYGHDTWHTLDTANRKRKLRSQEFLMLEKRKKPIVVTDILLFKTYTCTYSSTFIVT